MYEIYRFWKKKIVWKNNIKNLLYHVFWKYYYTFFSWHDCILNIFCTVLVLVLVLLRFFKTTNMSVYIKTWKNSYEICRGTWYCTVYVTGTGTLYLSEKRESIGVSCHIDIAKSIHIVRIHIFLQVYIILNLHFDFFRNE